MYENWKKQWKTVLHSRIERKSPHKKQKPPCGFDTSFFTPVPYSSLSSPRRLKITYLNHDERYIFMIDHRSYTQNLKAVVKLKPGKISGLNGIRTHDHCGIGAVVYQQSSQAVWELVTLWANIPVEGKGCKWIYER